MPEYTEHAIESFMREVVDGSCWVGSGSAVVLRDAIESYASDVIERGWGNAQQADRKTVQPIDIGVEQVGSKDQVQLALNPARNLCKQTVPSGGRISGDTVLAMVGILEEYIETVLIAAQLFMKHADRKTLTADDIDLYFELFTQFPE